MGHRVDKLPRPDGLHIKDDVLNTADLHDILQLFLQHPSAHCIGVVCKLLCISSGIREACGQHIPRAVVHMCLIVTNPQLAEHLSMWVAKHGWMLCSLSCSYSVASPAMNSRTAPYAQHIQNLRFLVTRVDHEPRACSAIAIGLQQAAENQRGLHLERFIGNPVSVPMLQHLPTSTLTQLVITRYATGSFSGERSKWPVPQLTNLCSLEVCSIDADELRSLSALTRLQDLSISTVSTPSNLAHLRTLPPQLQRLHLGIRSAGFIGHYDFNLGHLTALTQLCTTVEAGSHCSTGHVIRADDVLPPALRTLRLADCTSASPLLKLQYLQHLELTAADEAGPQQQQLTGLRQLSECQLVLRYWRNNATNQAATIWPLLPNLRVLELSDAAGIYYEPTVMSADAVLQLGSLQQLHKLAIMDTRVLSMPEQFAHQLGKLTQLQHLQLCYVTLLDPDGDYNSSSSDSDNGDDEEEKQQEEEVQQQHSAGVDGAAALEADIKIVAGTSGTDSGDIKVDTPEDSENSGPHGGAAAGRHDGEHDQAEDSPHSSLCDVGSAGCPPQDSAVSVVMSAVAGLLQLKVCQVHGLAYRPPTA